MRESRSSLEIKLNKEISAFLRQVDIKEYQVDRRQSITYDDFLTNKIWIILAIRTGIPLSLFNLIQDYTPFTEQDWAEFLDISTKSLHRYKMSEKYQFRPIHSEKIIEIAEVTKIGLDVFGNIDKLKLWLNTPNYALGKLKPIELLKDSYGKEMVIGELTRTSHGIFI